MAWADELDQAYSAYKNRDSFSYDPNSDSGYKQFQQAYMALGKQAMKDTIGQSSALTGGYGNSWAQSAGQQAYNNYAGQAAQAIPQFYNMALQQYQVEGDRLTNQYNMAANERNHEYQVERDAVADKQWQDQFNYQKERDSVADSHWQQEYDATYDRWKQEFLYQQSRDKVADNQWQQSFDYNKSRDAVADRQWQQSYDYNKSRDAVADSQWQKSFDYNQSKDALANSQWQQTFDYQKQQDAAELAYKYAALNNKSSSSGSSKGSGTTADFNPLKYSYNDWLKDYETAIRTNGLTDASKMLNEWLNSGWITATDWNKMRDHAMKKVLIPEKDSIKR